jgi:hypothetical protein
VSGRIRSTLAAVVAGGVLLLGAQAALGAPIVVVVAGHLGRKAVEVKTASARWTAVAEGEYVDANYVTKPDPNALRGRAAVKETSGVQRIRIQDVALQQRQSDGSWKTIKQLTEDVVRQQPTAYAIAYTPTVGTCWTDDRVRDYRVVHHYGVRQTSGTATNRSLTSNIFKGPMLASDPACPRGAFNAWLAGGPTELTLGEPHEVWYLSNFVSIDDQPVSGVTVVVNFDDSLEVELLEAGGLALNEASPDPNDYYLEGATWPSSGEEQVNARFRVTPTRLGSIVSGGSTQSTDPKVEAQEDIWRSEVVQAPVEEG